MYLSHDSMETIGNPLTCHSQPAKKKSNTSQVRTPGRNTLSPRFELERFESGPCAMLLPARVWALSPLALESDQKLLQKKVKVIYDDTVELNCVIAELHDIRLILMIFPWCFRALWHTFWDGNKFSVISCPQSQLVKTNDCSPNILNDTCLKMIKYMYIWMDNYSFSISFTTTWIWFADICCRPIQLSIGPSLGSEQFREGALLHQRKTLQAVRSRRGPSTEKSLLRCLCCPKSFSAWIFKNLHVFNPRKSCKNSSLNSISKTTVECWPKLIKSRAQRCRHRRCWGHLDWLTQPFLEGVELTLLVCICMHICIYSILLLEDWHCWTRRFWTDKLDR